MKLTNEQVKEIEDFCDDIYGFVPKDIWQTTARWWSKEYRETESILAEGEVFTRPISKLSKSDGDVSEYHVQEEIGGNIVEIKMKYKEV
jgi:hypothetical protein